ncbi:MAG: hypothetical protein E7349_03415 [Clostridiales bacterium]|nr:hypothetical protein [Clostridiales bacterium]
MRDTPYTDEAIQNDGLNITHFLLAFFCTLCSLFFYTCSIYFIASHFGAGESVIDGLKNLYVYQYFEKFCHSTNGEIEGLSYFICGTVILLLLSDSLKVNLSFLFYPIYIIFCVGVFLWLILCGIYPTTSPIEYFPTLTENLSWEAIWGLRNNSQFLVSFFTLVPLAVDIFKITYHKDKMNRKLKEAHRNAIYNYDSFSAYGQDQKNVVRFLRVRNSSYWILIFIMLNAAASVFFYEHVVLCAVINIALDIVSAILTNKVFKRKIEEVGI